MRPWEAVERLLRSPWIVTIGWVLQGCTSDRTGPPTGGAISPRTAEIGDSGPDATVSAGNSEANGDADDAADATDAGNFSDAAIDIIEAADISDANDVAAYDAPESYLAAESVIRTSCAFIRCHGGAVRGGAGLWFGQTTSIRGPLVNVVACEYSKMMRVAPGDVANSWMMVKLTAPQDPQTHAILFSPEAGWVPNPNCGLDPADSGGAFGLRMPETGMFQLDSDSVAKLAAWIEAGAPGPN